MSKNNFSDVLASYDRQASEAHCVSDWIDHFHMTVCQYFRHCEDNNKRATITGLKKEIYEVAKSEFNFK